MTPVPALFFNFTTVVEMTSLLVKAVGKYLDAFIRDFKSDKLSMNLMRGKLELKNVEFNLDVLQVLLGLPPSLVLTHAACTSLNIDVRRRRTLLCCLFFCGHFFFLLQRRFRGQSSRNRQ